MWWLMGATTLHVANLIKLFACKPRQLS
jgi:hypothetical protein